MILICRRVVHIDKIDDNNQDGNTMEGSMNETDEDNEMINELARLLLKIRRQPHLREQLDFNRVIDSICTDSKKKDIVNNGNDNNDANKDVGDSYRGSHITFREENYGSDDDSDFDSTDITLRTIKSSNTRDNRHRYIHRNSNSNIGSEEKMGESSPHPASIASSIFNMFRPDTAFR